jgi:uncharacterized membrane protein HdeD (DUF308 family)
MIRLIAILFGIAFIFAGVAGFMPAFTTNGALAGIFAVNNMHNIVHLVCGVLAIMAATNYKSTHLYFMIFGVVFILTSIVGFVRGDLFFMRLNTADNFLYLIIGILFLLLMYYARKK